MTKLNTLQQQGSVSRAAEFPRVRRGAHCLPSLLLSQRTLLEVPGTYSIRIFAIDIFVTSIFTA